MRRPVLAPVVPLLLALAACGPALAGDKAPAAPAAKTAARSWEEKAGDVRVLHLSGTPEEMGAQMGKACAAEVKLLVEKNLKALPFVAKDPKRAIEVARRLGKNIPDEQQREMREVAKAAGVEEDWMFVAACVIEVMEEQGACAAVGAWGKATPDHETIVGRNLDWFDLGNLHEHGLLVVRHGSGGRHTFVSAGFPGIPGVLTGMNDTGTFTADLVLYGVGAKPAAGNGVPVMSLQRLALETCADADAVNALYEKSGRTSPQNYIVADAKGARFLETDSSSVKRRDAVNDTVAGTNFAEEKRGEGTLDGRFEGLCTCIDGCCGKIGVAEVENALGAANTGPLSVMSVVAIPKRRIFHVSTGHMPACAGPFTEVDAGKLLDEKAPAK